MVKCTLPKRNGAAGKYRKGALCETSLRMERPYGDAGSKFLRGTSEGNLLKHLQREQFALGAPEEFLVPREVRHRLVTHREVITVRPHPAIIVGVQHRANIHQWYVCGRGNIANDGVENLRLAIIERVCHWEGREYRDNTVV